MKKSSPSIGHYVVSVKWTVKILSIFVAFSENMNFNRMNAALILAGNSWKRYRIVFINLVFINRLINI